MSEAMSAEFDTVAEWTAQVARELGPDYHVPGGCRGSGSPAALDWLTDALELRSDEVFLDCGAGVGGPAAHAARRRGVRPVLVEPEAGATRAARSLFDHPVIRADASALPVADESVDAAWALGVLCTTTEQLALLEELRRVVRPPGRIGLLVLVARSSSLDEQPEGNHFPTVDGLSGLIDAAGLRIDAQCGADDVSGVPDDWARRADAVTAALVERHGAERAWQQAENQSALIGRLIKSHQVSTELLALRRRPT